MNQKSNCQLQRFSTIFKTLHTHPRRGAAKLRPSQMRYADTPPRQATKLTYNASLKNEHKLMLSLI